MREITFNVYTRDGKYLGSVRAVDFNTAENVAKNRWINENGLSIRMCM